MNLKKLELKDKSIIREYLNFAQHELSNFSFANLFIWKDLFNIFWQIIEDNLCIFFRDNIGCFMYLPPLGRQISKRAVIESFQIMDKMNENRAISRIENVENKDLDFYNKLGFKNRLKTKEYIYKNNDIINLSGNKYKTKRSAYNYFLNNYNYEYLEFSAQMKDECLELYNIWKIKRKEKYKDSIYQQMLEDSFSINRLSMDYYKDLDLVGRIIKISNKIKAYSFGYKLNDDTFCILTEVADLNIKGLAQFIFRMFCSENKKFKYINAMDDSGLTNLEKTKLSYHPYKLEDSYIIFRE